jgi:hypothetical protein
MCAWGPKPVRLTLMGHNEVGVWTLEFGSGQGVELPA